LPKVDKRREKNYCAVREGISGARIALNFQPLELLVATILSAHVRICWLTGNKNLFLKYRTVEDYARASLPTFEQDIRSTGFYHNKAKNIINAIKIIKEKFDGKVPKRWRS